MAIITLTTDWKLNDFYVGAIKGRILSRCPDANVIDISHQISTFNISEAAFVVQNSYSHFPAGTIHLIGVSAEALKNHPHIILKADGHYFVSADNGVLGLIFTEKIEFSVVKIELTKFDPIEKIIKPDAMSFPELNVLSEAAALLAGGTDMLELGTPVADFYKQIPIRPVIEESTITGKIVYIDSYQNAITNITKELFYKIGKNRSFKIYVKSNYYTITKINHKYSEISVGELLALFNSTGLLEIAINSGNICELLALDTDSTIRVNFFNRK